MLPDGEKNSKITLFVLTQLTNVTDGQTDTPHDGKTEPILAKLTPVDSTQLKCNNTVKQEVNVI